jgi:hypothetical protein
MARRAEEIVLVRCRVTNCSVHTPIEDLPQLEPLATRTSGVIKLIPLDVRCAYHRACPFALDDPSAS